MIEHPYSVRRLNLWSLLYNTSIIIGNKPSMIHKRSTHFEMSRKQRHIDRDICLAVSSSGVIVK